MGILDDAIREHLDLIRQRGATDTEVQRLEDEAFGPPTRPDEADFPESEGGAGSGNGVATEAALDEPEDLAAHEDVTTLLPAEEAIEEPPAETPGTGLEEPTGAHITEDIEEEGESVLGEPVEGPVAEDATSLYDQGGDEGMDVDLDLTLEEEPADEEPPSEERPVDHPEGATPLEPPIESLDTVEHPFPDEIPEDEEPLEEAAPSEEHDVVDEEGLAAPEADEEDAEESEEGDEDVLADTPEFLKDQPEDDELWFEQGEPKDFDF